jgi:hypothetical protein
MPAERPTRTAGIEVPITTKVDKRSTKQAHSDLKSLYKDLSKFDVTWKGIGKQASLNVKEINKISTAAAQLSKKLSQAARESFSKLHGLSNQLEKAQSKAAKLSKEYGKAEPGRRKEIGEELEVLQSSISDLNKQVELQKKNTQKYNGQLERGLKVQNKNIAVLQKAADYNPKDVLHDMFANLKGGDIKGVLSTLVKGGVGKYARGASARAEAVGGPAGAAMQAGAGSMLGTLGTAAVALGAAAAAIGVIVKLIAAASSHMTDLNKALLSGGGFVNDFVSSTASYKGTVDEMRNAAIGMRGEVMKYGMTSEDVLKTINAFSKESTGSLLKTHDTLVRLGKGDVQVGMKEFAETAMVYGKALNMEASEVGSMMGKFVNDMGYGADQVQHLMGNIVQAAATSNMPMTKFMDIFRQVIPDVELYQNRIEELTGVIKLLSKTMSAKDVKNFMDAFSRGFKGQDFRSRLKTMLIVGEGRVSSALATDFKNKAQTIAQSWEQYGIQPDEFVKAMQGGEKTMAALVTKAQAAASKKGGIIAGEQISNAMKLAGYEGARRKGGLSTVTAMRGAGAVATYKIIKDLSQRLSTGFDGLSEHVIQQKGISDQQYEALRTMHQTMEAQQDMLKTYGKTNSKSMNKALRETIQLRKYGKIDANAAVDLKEATEEDLIAAAEKSNEELASTKKKASDLATAQYDVTSSIGDKIENIVGFLLEKLYQLMTGVLDAINGLLSWSISGVGDKARVADVKSIAAEVKSSNKELIAKQPEAGAMIDDISAAITEGIGAGKTGEDLARLVAQNKTMQASLQKAEDTPGGISTLAEQVKDLAEKTGSSKDEAENVRAGFLMAMQKGDFAGALTKIPGDMHKNLMWLVGRMQRSGFVPDKKDIERMVLKRPDAKATETWQERKAREEHEALMQERGDIDVLGQPMGTGVSETLPPLTPSGGTPETPAAAMSTGAPGASSTPTAPGGATPAEHKESVTASVDAAQTAKDSLDTQEDAADKQDDIYGGVKDVAGMLKKGIMFNNSWMTNKYKNVLKEASLMSLRTALTEQLVGYAKLWEDKDGFREALADAGDELMDKGGLKSGLAGLSDKGSITGLLQKVRDPGWNPAQAAAVARMGTPATGHAAGASAGAVSAPKGADHSTTNVTVNAQGTSASQVASMVEDNMSHS